VCGRARSKLARVATFSTRFLGCKVSFADAQAIRERLLADGHREVEIGGEIQVVNTCCVTHEAVSKSRQAASRAARSARTVYVTGCASNLDDAFTGVAPNVVVTRRTGDDAATFVATDVGAIGCVNAEHRLDRVRAFVKIQDGCSFSCAVRRGAGRPTPCSARSVGGSRKATARSC
jgi:threonylcarbamoyladenosine tRNA methylthiotransferase MtaB